MEKVRFNYSKVGFAKAEDDNDVTLDGVSLIDDLTPNALRKAAVYGLYVVGCRSLAGHTADNDDEKKALITKAVNWYVDDCPKREKATIDQFLNTCRKIMASELPKAAKKATIDSLEKAFNRTFEE
jgi:hypothetical protein